MLADHQARAGAVLSARRPGLLWGRARAQLRLRRFRQRQGALRGTAKATSRRARRLVPAANLPGRGTREPWAWRRLAEKPRRGRIGLSLLPMCSYASRPFLPRRLPAGHDERERLTNGLLGPCLRQNLGLCSKMPRHGRSRLKIAQRGLESGEIHVSTIVSGALLHSRSQPQLTACASRGAFQPWRGA